MNYDHPTIKKLVFGMSGTGKTTLIQKLAAGYPARWKFVWDHKLEFARKLGWKAARTPDELCFQFDHGMPVVYYPGDGDWKRKFAQFCQFVKNQSERKNGVKLFVADELQDYTGTGPVGATNGIPESFEWLLNNGRMQEIDLLLGAQSLTYVHNRIGFQASEIYMFKHSKMAIRALQKLKEAYIDPQALRSLPHPSVDRKVGYIYLNCLTDQERTVIHALD